MRMEFLKEYKINKFQICYYNASEIGGKTKDICSHLQLLNYLEDKFLFGMENQISDTISKTAFLLKLNYYYLSIISQLLNDFLKIKL